MKKIHSISQFLPLAIFLLLCLLLWRGLSLDPKKLPSTRLNQSVPEFSLPDLLQPNAYLTAKDFVGRPVLLNIWATWCNACAEEHALLMQLAQRDQVTIYGLNYKDQAEKARAWLQQHGNPYQKIGFDPTGQAALEWGVYGTPETFVIDRHGIVRYKHIGPLTDRVWREQIAPFLK